MFSIICNANINTFYEITKIDGKKLLLQQVHESVAKHINIFTANDGKYIEDVI